MTITESTRRKRIAVAGTFILFSAIVLSACWTTSTTTADPHVWLLHNYSLSPGIEVGKVTSCHYLSSTVTGRKDLCRVVEGYEEVGDNQNWDIQIFNGDPDQLLGLSCFNLAGGGGCDLIAPDRAMYEGCIPYNIDNGKDYWCDYRVSKPVVMNINDTWTRYLWLAWNWSLSELVANTACTVGLTAALAGQAGITQAFLLGCLDRPL